MNIAQTLKAFYDSHEDVELLLGSANAFNHVLESIDDYDVEYTFEDGSKLKIESVPMGDFVEVVV